MTVNVMYKLEELEESWARQLGTYGWSMGEAIGTEFVCWIDQFACGGCAPGGHAETIRIASHRMLLGQDFQFKTLAQYQVLWEAVTTGYIFRDLSREDNDAKCKAMDKLGQNYTNVQHGSKEEWANSLVEDKKWFLK